ncbi:MAG: hypothetical protein WA892_06480, partial [Ornithinimicrobium sp.]
PTDLSVTGLMRADTKRCASPQSIDRLNGYPIIDVSHRPRQFTAIDPDGQLDLVIVVIHVTILHRCGHEGPV